MFLDGGLPTEERVKVEFSRFPFIHFASHGFFRPEGSGSYWLNSNQGEKSPVDSFESKVEALFRRSFPGLRSGIVCAGANTKLDESRENGLLTAEEVSWLDLSHCDLVVLSACQSGLGTIRGGEGMVGLRSAFRQAGAKTVISSLWSVGDRSTAELMGSFYRALWTKGRGKLEALREAQLEMIKSQRKLFDGQVYPYAWGAFVLDGYWQ